MKPCHGPFLSISKRNFQSDWASDCLLAVTQTPMSFLERSSNLFFIIILLLFVVITSHIVLTDGMQETLLYIIALLVEVMPGIFCSPLLAMKFLILSDFQLKFTFNFPFFIKSGPNIWHHFPQCLKTSYNIKRCNHCWGGKWAVVLTVRGGYKHKSARGLAYPQASSECSH